MVYNSHMKTTMDISDNILIRAKALAKKENVTLRTLMEEGLEMAIEAHHTRNKYAVKPVVFSGDGLAPEYQQKGWTGIRDEIYDRR